MGNILYDIRLLKNYICSRMNTLQMRLAHDIEFNQADVNGVERSEGGMQELQIVFDYMEKLERHA